MSPDVFKETKIKQSDQVLTRTPNPGTYRSCRRDNRLLDFVQHAFAAGVIERIDEKKTLQNDSSKWERQKWMLVRYVSDPKTTLNDVKRYAGVNTRERVRQLYRAALFTIWEESPIGIQQRYPKEALCGKMTDPPRPSANTLRKIGESLRTSKIAQEARAKGTTAWRGSKHTAESKSKMRAARRRRK